VAEVRPYSEGCIFERDAVIYHHSIGSAVTPAILSIVGPKCLIYHNITPHQYLEPYLPLHAQLCREGRDELSRLASSFPVSVGDSNFNALNSRRRAFANGRTPYLC